MTETIEIDEWPSDPVPTSATLFEGSITDWPTRQSLDSVEKFVDRGTYKAGQLMDFPEISMALVVIPAGMAHPPHFHPEGPHVIIVKSGHGVMRVGKSRFPISPNDVILIPKNVVHMAESVGDTDLKYTQLIVPAAAAQGKK